MVSKLQAETSELKLSLATTQRDSSKYENEISELKKQLQEQTGITSTLRSELDTFTNIKLKQSLLEINAQNWENFNSQQQKAAQQVKTDLSELEGKLTRAIENKLLDLKTDNAATASFNVDDVVEKQNIRLREVELELRDSIDAKLSKLGRDLDNKYGTYC
jgi:predicted RNase H-like nuclease (RuvC/YqgF family)